MSTAAGSAESPRTPTVRQLLIFRALQVGDMLCAVPALRALRKGFPQAELTLIGLPWASQFARRFSAYIDDFIPFPGHPALPEQRASLTTFENFADSVSVRKADLALQMHGSGDVSNAIVARFGARQMAGFFRPPSPPPVKGYFLAYPALGHEIQRLLSLATWAGGKPDGDTLAFPLTREDYDELARQPFAERLQTTAYVCLHAGARDRSKCWPVECFAALAEKLSTEFGLEIVLTGSAAEHELAASVSASLAERTSRPAINAASDISLGAMTALIQGSRLLVCNDTAVSHMACALDIASVVVFVNSEMDRWAPQDRRRHRCVHDPDGHKLQEVLWHANSLLSGSAL